jgi:hypothetical protein
MAPHHEPKAERPIEDFAEELSRLLEAARARAQDWLGQRHQVAKTLEGIRDTAENLLRQLGDGLPASHPASKRRGSRRSSRVMSAEARERIRQAQLKRWAKQRAGDKKK